MIILYRPLRNSSVKTGSVKTVSISNSAVTFLTNEKQTYTNEFNFELMLHFTVKILNEILQY